jgi:predicted acetyltransferase
VLTFAKMSWLDHPEEMRDRELSLELTSFETDPVHKVPTYYFRMLHAETVADLGHIRLRVKSTRHVELYAGHIGYLVHEPHRGHRYASRAVALLIPLARECGINPVWFTCDPENAASRRTLEIVGARFVELINVPENCIVRRDGHPQKCRYRLDI